MSENKQLQDLKTIVEDTTNQSVPITTAFKNNVAMALIKYQRDKGLSHPQDVIRLAAANFLTRAGYLNQ